MSFWLDVGSSFPKAVGYSGRTGGSDGSRDGGQDSLRIELVDPLPFEFNNEHVPRAVEIDAEGPVEDRTSGRSRRSGGGSRVSRLAG